MSTSPNIASTLSSATPTFLQSQENQENSSPNNQNKPNSNPSPIDHQNALIIEKADSSNFNSSPVAPQIGTEFPIDEQSSIGMSPGNRGIGTSLGIGGGIVGNPERQGSFGVGPGNIGVGGDRGIGGGHGPELDPKEIAIIAKNVHDKRNVVTTNFYVAPEKSTALSDINEQQQEEMIIEQEIEGNERSNAQILKEANFNLEQKNPIGAEILA